MKTKLTILRFTILLWGGLFALDLAGTAHAQGVTSAAMNGRVTDELGEPLPGANVVAVHEPTNTQYGTTTDTDGRYHIGQMRPGGPYTVTVSFIGFTPEREAEISLVLGQTRELSFALAEATAELGEVEVLGEASSVLNSERTGASTNIDQETIERLPTISRSLADFARLTPQAASGLTNEQVSVGGRNNRYNNITIDGATLNDVFGLSDTGAPGGQAGAQPISLDAIQEFNVDIAPYDVRYNGFTGGTINAITRSGSNRFSGSVRYLGRNESFVGGLPTPEGGIDTYPDFSEQFFVGSLGGPILRDRLFFFANAEYQTENAPLDAGIQGSGSANVFPVPADSLNRIINIARDRYGYDPGGFDPLSQRTENVKLLGKLDWNISPAHRANLRVNYVDADDDAGISRSQQNFDLSNRQYVFRSRTLSSVAELRSTFGSNLFNEGRLVYTRIRDNRDVQADPFPYVSIDVTADETVYLGIDRFSQANALDQDIWELTNNLTYVTGPHTLTFGTSNQLYRFSNLFIQDYYGAYEFDSIDDFAAGDPRRFYFSYSRLDERQPRAEFTALQLGIYAQDQYRVNPFLTVTAGLRLDAPVFPEDPLANPAAEEAFGQNTSEIPGTNLLFSPRLGFNWDASRGERTTQLRGGTGIFSGKAPYVWISNAYSNTGVDFARVDERDVGFFVPSADPSEILERARDLDIAQTSEINLVDPDFSFPQVWRTNLALDQRLAYGVIGTLEGIYTKAINDITFTNLNLVQQSTAFDGRPVYGSVGFTGSTSRTASGSTARLDSRFTNAILMQNTGQGYEYSLTAMLRRQSPTGLDATLAYTFSRATNVNNATSSRAISNWQYNENFDVNDPSLGTADFEVRHRILTNLSYRIEYAGRFATTVGVVYDGRSGEPFSWVYNGNANADTRFDNDLVYVPNEASEIVLVTDNWDALDAFIASEPSLSDARGDVVRRNTARAPRVNLLDLQVTQEIATVGGQRFELTANLLNVLNVLNEDWGEVQYALNNAVRLLNFYGYVEPDDVGTTVDGRTLTADDVGKPVIGFNAAEDREALFSTAPLSSRWQLQLGVRYVF